jgi:hypothetical protein
MCPHCDYTVYRPVTVQPVITVKNGVERVIGETRSAEFPIGGAALADRRQRAREAYHDASGLGDNGWHAAEQAIETATRVKITQDMIEAGRGAVPELWVTNAQAVDFLEAVFAAAGFEVESEQDRCL